MSWGSEVYDPFIQQILQNKPSSWIFDKAAKLQSVSITDTGTFYGSSTDIDTEAQYPKFNTDILVFPVFYSISILCFKPLIDSFYLLLLAL